MSDLNTFSFPLTGPSVTAADTTASSLLATFNTSMMAPKIDSRSGDLILQLRVVAADKYAAIPLTEVLGRKLTIAVHGPRATQKHLGVGVERQSAARERVAERRRLRGWEAEMDSWLIDEDEDGEIEGE